MGLLNILTDYVLPFLPILTLVVFVHELGHYLVARWNGVTVETFSIGFGPELIGFNDRAGTRWRISAIPLGGYVKMLGDVDASSATSLDVAEMSEADRAKAFPAKRVGQRAAIVAAGPAANFIFAVALLAGLYAIVGQPFTAPRIATVDPGSAAEAAGFKTGDLVVSLDGSFIDRFEDLQRIVRMNPGKPMTAELERDGARLTLAVTPGVRDVTDRFGNVQKFGMLGVRSTEIKTVRHDPATAVMRATMEVYSISAGTLESLGQIVTGARNSDEIGGVLRIAHMSGEVARSGVVTTLIFIALLSVNLGLINLFPIPVLDGGHLMFYAAEAVRGRPLEKRIQEYGSMVGLAAVLGLMVFATWNDLVHLRIVSFISSLIS